MKFLVALILSGCSNSSADVVPKIPNMSCKPLSINMPNDIIYKCEDKDVICYMTKCENNLSCIKKENK